MDFIAGLFPEIEGKKIIIFGADATGLAFMYEAERAGVAVSYAVDSNQTKWGGEIFGRKICSPYDLLYEDKDNLKIVICSITGKDSMIAMLEDMGFDRQRHIVTKYVEKRDGCTHVDVTLGVSRGKQTIFNMDSKIKAVDKKKRILILGGSTSDPTYNGIHSWPFYLQQIMYDNFLDVQVLNGAVITYNSSQELLCLLRDGLRSSPDIVISYSGVNDYTQGNELPDGTRIPLVGRNLYDLETRLVSAYVQNKYLPPMYYGEKTKDGFGLWLYNMRSMHALCVEFGAEFYSIFQPIMKNQDNKGDYLAERMLKDQMVINLSRRFDSFYTEFKKVQKDYHYMYDFTDICSNTEGGGIFRILAIQMRTVTS